MDQNRNPDLNVERVNVTSTTYNPDDNTYVETGTTEDGAQATVIVDAGDDGDDSLTVTDQVVETDYADGTIQTDDGLVTTTTYTDGNALIEPNSNRDADEAKADAGVHGGITAVTTQTTWSDGSVITDDGTMTEVDAPDGSVSLSVDDQGESDLADVLASNADGLDAVAGLDDVPAGAVIDDGTVDPAIEADAVAAFTEPTFSADVDSTRAVVIEDLDEDPGD